MRYCADWRGTMQAAHLTDDVVMITAAGYTLRNHSSDAPNIDAHLTF